MSEQPCRFTNGICRVCDEPESGMCRADPSDWPSLLAALRIVGNYSGRHLISKIAEREREIEALKAAVEDMAVTFRNYYAQAISRAVVEEKLEHYRELTRLRAERKEVRKRN